MIFHMIYLFERVVRPVCDVCVCVHARRTSNSQCAMCVPNTHRHMCAMCLSISSFPAFVLKATQWMRGDVKGKSTQMLKCTLLTSDVFKINEKKKTATHSIHIRLKRWLIFNTNNFVTNLFCSNFHLCRTDWQTNDRNRISGGMSNILSQNCGECIHLRSTETNKGIFGDGAFHRRIFSTRCRLFVGIFGFYNWNCNEYVARAKKQEVGTCARQNQRKTKENETQTKLSTEMNEERAGCGRSMVAAKKKKKTKTSTIY